MDRYKPPVLTDEEIRKEAIRFVAEQAEKAAAKRKAEETREDYFDRRKPYKGHGDPV